MTHPSEDIPVIAAPDRPGWLAALLRADDAPRGGMREVVLLAYPVVLTQISMTTMGIVDSAMVGTLGATELAAVGFGSIWMWTCVCFLMGTASAIQTFVSQQYGANAHGTCGAWTWQGIYAVGPLAALVSGALFVAAPTLIGLLGTSDGLRSVAAEYVGARSLGIVGLTVAASISGFFRGIGDTKTPLFATLIANGVNVVLDYGLIFGELGLPRWEARGAGAATAIAEWVTCAALLVPFLALRTRAAYRTTAMRPVARDIRRLIRTGAPIGGQWWLEMVSFAAFTTLIAQMGDAEMAASQAFVALLSMSFMQAIGLGIAVSTLVGQYIGSREPHLATKSFYSGMKLTCLLAAAIALLFSAFPDVLVGIFTDDPEVIALGRPLMLVGAVFQLCDAFGIVADGALRGAGDTRWPFLVRFTLAWLVFVPMAYVIGVVLDGGLTWAWTAGVVHVGLLSTALVWRFRSEAWQKIVI